MTQSCRDDCRGRSWPFPDNLERKVHFNVAIVLGVVSEQAFPTRTRSTKKASMFTIPPHWPILKLRLKCNRHLLLDVTITAKTYPRNPLSPPLKPF